MIPAPLSECTHVLVCEKGATDAGEETLPSFLVKVRTAPIDSSLANEADEGAGTAPFRGDSGETDDRNDSIIGRNQNRASLRQSMRANLLANQQVGRSSYEARFFEYTCIRYLWCDITDRFVASQINYPTGNQVMKTLELGGLTQNASDVQQSLSGKNAIKVKVPSVFESIMSEFFLVPISVFQFACCWTYFWYSAWNMAAFWFGTFAFAGIYKLKNF